jgi:hypothetical protein
MNAHVEGRSFGAAMRPLSKLQISDLILLARQAFNLLYDSGTLSETAEFGSWRHQQVQMTVERAGLRECRNDDYLPLRGHFLHLLNRHAEAQECESRHLTEARTWALARLRTTCADAADVMPAAWDYAAGFVRNKRGVEIDDADDKTLWHAVYTVKRRAEQLRKQKRGAV